MPRFPLAIVSTAWTTVRLVSNQWCRNGISYLTYQQQQSCIIKTMWVTLLLTVWLSIFHIDQHTHTHTHTLTCICVLQSQHRVVEDQEVGKPHWCTEVIQEVPHCVATLSRNRQCPHCVLHHGNWTLNVTNLSQTSNSLTQQEVLTSAFTSFYRHSTFASACLCCRTSTVVPE